MKRFSSAWLVLALLFPFPEGAGAAVVECGQSITGDTVLENDLACPGNGLVLAAGGITLDCAGHVLAGSGAGKGIVSDGRSQVTIRNCVVRNFANGIWVQGARSAAILDNRIYDTKQTAAWDSGSAIFLWVVSDSLVSGNTLDNNASGRWGGAIAFVNVCNRNTVSGNTIRNSGAIVLGTFGEGHVVTGNVLDNSSLYAHYTANSVISGNTVSNVPGTGIAVNNVYWHTLYGHTGQDSNLVSGNTVLDSNTGIVVSGSWGDAVRANVVSGCEVGIAVQEGSRGTLVEGNTVRDSRVVGAPDWNSGWGLVSWAVSDPVFRDNTVSNFPLGLYAINVNERTQVVGNTFSANSNAAIVVHQGEQLLISGNTIEGGGTGIRLMYSRGSIIQDNDIFGNVLGVNLTQYLSPVWTWFWRPGEEHGNKIYRNNIYLNSFFQVYSEAVAAELSWNGEGNWWGRSQAPCFVAGTDSNRADVTDSYPFCSKSAWRCADSDGDGYGAAGTETAGCPQQGFDCDDNDAAMFPGQDAGVCAICDGATGQVAFDPAQESDCPATSCPQAACGSGGCGANVFADYPAGVPNACADVFACTQNVCLAACEADADGDGYSASCGDCNDGAALSYAGAVERCDDLLDNDCDGQTNEGCAGPPQTPGQPQDPGPPAEPGIPGGEPPKGPPGGSPPGQRR